MAGQPGFFDLPDRYEALGAAGDPLERLAGVVDFAVFRGPLMSALRRSVRGKGGRPPFEPVMMFRILVLQAPCSLGMTRRNYGSRIACRSGGSRAWAATARFRLRRRCGCSASAWRRPGRQTSCSPASMRR